MAVDPAIAHLLRRAGFGHAPAEGEAYSQMGLPSAVDALVYYEQAPDTVDGYIGTPGYLGVTARGQFSPNTRISDSVQRVLFRMVHTGRPLQEKMALFWHNHFATGFSKVAGQLSVTGAARALAAKPSEDEAGLRGQYELFREHALGNFRDLLLQVSQDPAMVAWLDGDTNTKTKPQENYARELMELFTMGVDHFTEEDVYAGARVFTGWNLRRHAATDAGPYYTFQYRANEHDTGAKTFSFPIYPDGGRTIPARNDGLQDGIDLINAVVGHPETGPRLARKLYAYFVSEFKTPPEAFITELAGVYYATGYDMRAVVRRLLLSSEFQDPANHFARYSWPAEYVARLVKTVGWVGFSAEWASAPMANMGQSLFEPPTVAGWRLGADWFTTGSQLARMNFAAMLTYIQQFELHAAAAATGADATPDTLLDWVLDRMAGLPYSAGALNDLRDFVHAGVGSWTHALVRQKAAGLAHLIGGSSEFQFV